MNIVRENKTYIKESKNGVRILGYVKENDVTLSMYIMEWFDGDEKISINMVVGKWGEVHRVQSGKVAFFSILNLNPNPHFEFYNPSELQIAAYSSITDKILNADDVLNSPTYKDYQKMLDCVYQAECLPVISEGAIKSLIIGNHTFPDK